MATITAFTFDSQGTGVFWSPMKEALDRASGVTATLNGTKHIHRANFVQNNYYEWSGVLPAATYEALRTKARSGSVGTLDCDFGSFSATIVKCEGSVGPGVASGVTALVPTRLQFQRTDI